MAHECPDCTYVAHGDFIVVTAEHISRATITFGKAMKVLFKLAHPDDYIIELGKFTSDKWAGHAMWYLFECPDCGGFTRDYLHGHRLYLVCQHCTGRWYVSRRRFYDEVGIPAPPTWWQTFLEHRRRRRMYRKLRASS